MFFMVHGMTKEKEKMERPQPATTSTYEIGCLTRIPTPFQHFGTKANSSVDFEGRPATTITFVLGGHLIHTFISNGARKQWPQLKNRFEWEALRSSLENSFN